MIAKSECTSCWDAVWSINRIEHIATEDNTVFKNWKKKSLRTLLTDIGFRKYDKKIERATYGHKNIGQTLISSSLTTIIGESSICRNQ